MNVVIFVTIFSSVISSADLSKKFMGEALDFLKSESAVRVVEFYTPETGDVPRMEDVSAPAFIIQIDLGDAEAAKKLVDTERFQMLFTDKNSFSTAPEEIKLEITERVSFPLQGETVASARTAPLSFVVRYYGPIANASEFVRFYTKNQPPILSKFPGIRNILCYLPLDWEKQGNVLDNRLLVGNEVVFDNLEALNKALKSDVLPAARKDSMHFSKHFQLEHITHHAMHREKVFHREF
jgi:hypothetical protein